MGVGLHGKKSMKKKWAISYIYIYIRRTLGAPIVARGHVRCCPQMMKETADKPVDTYQKPCGHTTGSICRFCLLVLSAVSVVCLSVSVVCPVFVHQLSAG